MREVSRSPRPRGGTHCRPHERRVGAVSAAVATVAGAAVGLTAVLSFPSAASASRDNMVVNHAFEDGKHGWRSTGAQEHRFSVVRRPVEGSLAAELTTSERGRVSLTDKRSTVRDTQAGRSYSLSASVRAPRGDVEGVLRVRELEAGSQSRVGRVVFDLNDTKWHRVRLTYQARRSGARLDLSVVARELGRTKALLIDRVRLVAGPVSSPTNSCGTNSSARGLLSCGALLGAAVGSNTDPATRERQLGGTLGIRRTYFRSDQVAGAVSVARDDLAHGRVPWMSFKLPYSWAAMADGQGDAWARDLASRLDALDGPVWVAFHHEPEGDGDLEDWKAMQRHLSPLIRGGADNVAFTVIYMGWHEFFGSTPEYRMDAIWPGDGVVDVVGFDIYNNYGVTDDGATVTKMTELRDYYVRIAPWAQAHGVRWAVGETGYTDAAAAKDPAWLNRAYDDLVSYGGAALAYFDSELNSVGSWAMDTQPKIDAFKLSLARAPVADQP
jgi:hypothetical protein